MDEVTTAAASPSGGILERLLDEAEGRTPPSPLASSAVGGGADAEAVSPDREDGGGGAGNPLAALLGNPALLSALPSLMEILSSLSGVLGQGTGSTPATTRTHGADRHTALLCALKPYLSPHRQETVETVIRLCRVWDALERAGISPAGLMNLFGGITASGGEGGDTRV